MNRKIITKIRRVRKKSIFCQEPLEIAGFTYLLGQHNCKSYLEIGSRFGGSLLQTCSLMDRVVSIDAGAGPGGRPGALKKLKGNLERITKFGPETKLIEGFSTDPSVIEQALLEGPFDAVFIDAAHDYKSVKHDWETYGPLATKLVGFHDIHGRTKGKHILEVHILWKEIKQNHETIELIDTYGGMGIGVVLVNGSEKEWMP